MRKSGCCPRACQMRKRIEVEEAAQNLQVHSRLYITNRRHSSMCNSRSSFICMITPLECRHTTNWFECNVYTTPILPDLLVPGLLTGYHDSTNLLTPHHGAQYTLLRSRFMMCGLTGRDPLDDEFNFAEYLSLCAADTGENVVQLGFWSWVRVWFMVALIFGIMRISPHMWARCWTALSLVLVMITHLAHRHLEWTRDWLVPPLKPKPKLGAGPGSFTSPEGSRKVLRAMSIRKGRERRRSSTKTNTTTGGLTATGAGPTGAGPTGAGRRRSSITGTIIEKLHLGYDAVIGTGHLVGTVTHWLNENDQDITVKLMQVIILYSISSITAMCFHLAAYSSYTMQTEEIIILSVFGIAPLVVSLAIYPHRMYCDMVLAFNVEKLKKVKHVNTALRHAKIAKKLQSLRLLVAARSEIRFRVFLLQSHTKANKMLGAGGLLVPGAGGQRNIMKTTSTEKRSAGRRLRDSIVKLGGLGAWGSKTVRFLN